MQEKNTFINIFSSRLRSEMKTKGLTQSALAEVVKIRQTSISDYINGKAVPSAEVFYRISLALGVPMEALAGADDKTTAQSKHSLAQENAMLKERIKALTTGIRAVLDKFDAK